MFPLRTWSRKMPWNVTWVLESPKSTKRYFFFFFNSTILQNEYTTIILQNEEGRRFFFKQTLVWENKENVSIFQQFKMNSTSLRIITLSMCWGLCIIQLWCQLSFNLLHSPAQRPIPFPLWEKIFLSQPGSLSTCWRLPAFFSNQKSGFLPVWLPYLSYHFLALFRN